MIGVPLLVGERLLGALFVAACRPSRPFDARDVALVERVARSCPAHNTLVHASEVSVRIESGAAAGA